ncbi:hypothetical protein K503DRAFT_865799 [Rhizopogon vinicolor AM-OR11-026]|uniref:Mid2 domain-containing protein n=1 Tax=Rhizopogon vinicolor AM-OR11-026 TaxID=1314800 RepID=A0A1B7N285_9AGAM|nr:hypothetical protein K503DRAFT_865799 [Rhizopogon vinicolor AM-OR11-026]
MSPTKTWSLIVVLVVTTLAPLGALAQTADISCLSPTFDWMNNTKNQNPCLVAAYLQGVCYDGEYTLNPLPVDTHYIGPYADEANSCECNTVTYSLVSACGDCQNRTYEAWSSWSFNCSTIYNSTYPMDIPTGTTVPHWAYLDVVTNDTFNPSLALQAGDSPESTATKVQSTGSTIPSTTSLFSLTPSPNIATSSAAQSTTSTSKSSNVGAIAGGVVGGVVGIAAIVGLAAWFCVKRRRSTTAPSAAFRDIDGGPGYTQSVYSANPHPFPMQPEMAQQPRLYDPSDPSTFPNSPPSPTIQTTSTSNIYQNPSIPSHVYSQQSRPGQYSGAPEV